MILDEIKELIENAIDIPVIEYVTPLTQTCATYNIYYEDAALIGNGKKENTRKAIQIDLWFKDIKIKELYNTTQQLIKKIEESSHYTCPTIDFNTDQVNKTSRSTIKFEKVE